jgi:hypothetical protein
MNQDRLGQRGLTKTEYAGMRARYTPRCSKIIFILESPPISGKYFYNPEGRTSEPLFSAMMKDVLEMSPKTKHDGLTEFATHGYLLIDATYVPANLPGSASAQNNSAAVQIQQDFPLLVEELNRHVQVDTRLLLVKANVCRLLDKPLKQHGFGVLNGNLAIPFPSNGQQPRFRAMVRQVLGLN